MMKKALAWGIALMMILSLAEAAFAASNSQTVYVTGTGKVYHESDCPNTWNGRYKTTLKEAHSNRLKPCTECNPVVYDKNDLETQEEYVYVLMGKAVYHNCDCAELWTEEAWPGYSMTLKTAQKEGLRACGICDPDTLSQRSLVFQVSETGAYHACDCRTIWRTRFKTTLDKLPDDARPCAYCHEFE